MESARSPLPEFVLPTTGSVLPADNVSAALMMETHAIIIINAVAMYVQRFASAAARPVRYALTTMIAHTVSVLSEKLETYAMLTLTVISQHAPIPAARMETLVLSTLTVIRKSVQPAVLGNVSSTLTAMLKNVQHLIPAPRLEILVT